MLDCEPSMGGVRTVAICNHAAVSVTETSGEITAIALSGNEKFKKYGMKPGTASMASTLNKSTENGTQYVSTEVAMSLKKMNTPKRIEIQALAAGELALLVQDNNGIWWFLGKDNPVEVTAGSGATGTAFADGNQYDLTLTDNAKAMPLALSSALAEDIDDYVE